MHHQFSNLQAQGAQDLSSENKKFIAATNNYIAEPSVASTRNLENGCRSLEDVVDRIMDSLLPVATASKLVPVAGNVSVADLELVDSTFYGTANSSSPLKKLGLL